MSMGANSRIKLVMMGSSGGWPLHTTRAPPILDRLSNHYDSNYVHS